MRWKLLTGVICMAAATALGATPTTRPATSRPAGMPDVTSISRPLLEAWATMFWKRWKAAEATIAEQEDRIGDDRLEIADLKRKLDEATLALDIYKKAFRTIHCTTMSVGDSGCLVRTDFGLENVSSFKIQQIVDGKNMILAGPSDNAYWLQGLNTAGFVDGKVVDLRGVNVTVAGTKQYTTALGGSRTVFLLTAAP